MDNKEYLLKGIEFLENTKPSELSMIFKSLKYQIAFKTKFLPRLKDYINDKEKTTEDLAREVGLI